MSTDLMKLKRSVAKPAPVTMKKKEKPEALLSRQAPGMSFDFHPKVCLVKFEMKVN